MFTKDKNKRAAIAAIVIVSIIAMSCVLSIFTDVFKVKDEQSIGINGIGNLTSNMALNVTYPTSGELGQFANGYSYVFTDKDKVDDFRAGNIDYDMTILKVDTTQPHGSQKNPYVIASIDDWDRFAKNLDVGTIPNYGSGKYFILANNLDFDGKIFHPIRFFNGTFYGLGYKLQNISVNGTAGWVYWNGSNYVQIPTSGASSPYGYGVFCRTLNSTIADLIVENFEYKQMPATAIYTSRNMTSTGGVAGQSNGQDYFLNCQTIGAIESNIVYSHHTPSAGIIGAHATKSSAAALLVYRCSSKVSISTESAAAFTTIHSGIIGDAYDAGNIVIYDCAANIISNTNTGAHTSASIAAGVIGSDTLYLENVIGTINVNTTVNAGSGR